MTHLPINRRMELPGNELRVASGVRCRKLIHACGVNSQESRALWTEKSPAQLGQSPICPNCECEI